MPNLYTIIAKDKPGAGAIRTAMLREHLAHVEAQIDRLAVAGPLKDEEGNFTGSLLVVKAASEADARAMLEQDPYFQAGVWSHVEIHAFSAVAGDWVGGKTW
ncbi:MAG: YciI family protein [Erythrobacteraceae bacterium]|jgi:uncharacterized protein YciI|nr:YciI family protein [Erythrobacteraceae bacterium]